MCVWQRGVALTDQIGQLYFLANYKIGLEICAPHRLRSPARRRRGPRVVTTNANADRGRSSGAQISLVTKSGTNQFRGSAYEFHRNSATAANDFFNQRVGIGKPELIRNVFGGSAGGPPVRSRAFLFATYEGRRDASETTVVRSVPTAAFRDGFIRYLNTADGMSEIGPEQLRALDPLGIGANAGILDHLRRYPL